MSANVGEVKMGKDVRIEVPIAHMDLTDRIPSAYHTWAIDYYAYYSSNTQTQLRFSPVPYVLLFNVIELELKASFLQSTGKGSLGAKKFNHRLYDAYESLDTKDKILTPDEVDMLKQAQKVLENEHKAFSYFLPIALLTDHHMPELKQLELVAKKLVEYGERLGSLVGKNA